MTLPANRRRGELADHMRWPLITGTAAALAFGGVAYLTPVMQSAALRPTVTIAANGGGNGAATNYALYFNNDNSVVADSGRVKILIDDTTTTGTVTFPQDVGDTVFTIEFWFRGADADNTKNINRGSNCNVTAGGGGWTRSDIIYDRDIRGQWSSFGIGLTDSTIVWGVIDAAGNSYGQCSSSNVQDDAWHHAAFTFDNTGGGTMALYVDGTREAFSSATGVTGDASYPDDYQPAGSDLDSDPYIVLGAEKHDIDPNQFGNFNGRLDELRVSNSIRYTGTSFTVDSTRFTVDSATVLLLHFDEGSGTAAINDAAVYGWHAFPAGENPDGVVHASDANGPTWETSGAPTGLEVFFWSDHRTATGPSLNAVQDGGKWNYNPLSNTENVFVRTLASEGLGNEWASSTNIVEVGAYEGTGNRIPCVDSLAASVPAVGESWHHRYYVRVHAPDSLDADLAGAVNNHPIESGCTGQGIAWAHRYEINGTGVNSNRFTLTFRNSFDTGSPYYANETANNWWRNVTYLVQTEFRRTYTDSVFMLVRVDSMDSAGNLIRLYEPVDFLNNGGAGPGTLNDSVNVGASVAELDELGIARMGVNGFDERPYAYDYMYQGAFAICRSLCGPYPIAGVEN